MKGKSTAELMPPKLEYRFDVPRDPVPGSEAYDDGQLYRVIVAKALREGRFASKAEFDLEVRRLGTIKEAEEVIAFSQRRPGCKAWRHGNLMVCDCGTAWKVDSADPPKCKPM